MALLRLTRVMATSESSTSAVLPFGAPFAAEFFGLGVRTWNGAPNLSGVFLMNYRNIRTAVAVVPASLLALSQNAMAALPTGVSTEIAGAKTDVLELGALVFGITIAVALYKWFKRAV